MPGVFPRDQPIEYAKTNINKKESMKNRGDLERTTYSPKSTARSADKSVVGDSNILKF